MQGLDIANLESLKKRTTFAVPFFHYIVTDQNIVYQVGKGRIYNQSGIFSIRLAHHDLQR